MAKYRKKVPGRQVPVGEGKVMSFWPGVSCFSWCGEYEMTDHEEAGHGTD